MKYLFARISTIFLVCCLFGALTLSQSSCSRKSGCPAENVHVKTDKDGMPKSGKPTSGLLPPKSGKKKSR